MAHAHHSHESFPVHRRWRGLVWTLAVLAVLLLLAILPAPVESSVPAGDPAAFATPAPQDWRGNSAWIPPVD
jgi:hypothetical protein